MSNFEVIEKAINEHGQSVEELKSGLNARMDDMEQKLVRRGGESYTRETASPVSSFIESGQLQQFAEGANSTGRVMLKGSDIKTLTKAISSTDVDVQPQRATGLYNDPRENLSLLNLLPVIPVSSGSFEFMALTTAANSAGYQVAEGDEKDESNPAFDLKTANIAQIAHYVIASNQVLSDSPALMNQLDSLLRYGVMHKLEAELLNGAGGTGEILGLMPQATDFTHTATAPADRIGEAVTSLGAAGWNANVVVMNHQDWFAIASSKSTDEDYIMGSPRNPAPPSLWGLPVVLSAAMASGTALVLDTAQTALLDREQVAVMASREPGFTTNQTYILGEGRYGCAVFAPGAVLSVDLTEA